MAPEISKNGKFASLLLETEEKKRSGVLTMEFQKIKKVICFEEGNIRYAASNIRTEFFLAYLIHAGIVDKNLTASFLHEPAISEETAQLLINAGSITEEKAMAEARNLIRKIVTSCFRISGRLTFSEGKANLKGKITALISPRSIVIDYYRNHASVIECKLITGREILIPQIMPGAEEKMRTTELSDSEKNLLRMIDGATKLKDILRIVPEKPEQTLRNVTVLSLIGLIDLKEKATPVAQSKGEEGKDSSEAPAPAVTEESEEDLERKKYYHGFYEKHIRSNFFQLLGVQRHSSQEEVRNGYYNLARELHPDHFQKESMKDLRPLMENLFAKISEAYNVLSNEEARKKYEAETFGEVEAPPQPQEAKMDNVTLAKGNFFKGKKLFQEEKYPDAMKFLQNAVSLDPTRWEYFLYLGMTQARNPRFRSEAMENLKKTITMNPTSAEGYLELGILFRKSGKTAEARNMLQCALQWDPGNAVAAFELKELEKAESIAK